MSSKKDKYYLNLALDLAKDREGLTGSNPSVGAVIVKNDLVISQGQTGFGGRPHAEFNAINSCKTNELKGSTMYVTLEPCLMCMGALYWSQLDRIVFGAADPKRGFVAKGIQAHPKTQVQGGILAEASALILEDFFKKKR